MKHMKSVSTFIAATWGAAFILYLPASVSSSLRASGELAEGRASKFGASNVVSGLEENFPNAKRLSGVKSSPAASAELRADLTAFHLKQPMSLPTEIEVLKTLSDKLCDEKISFSEKLHHVVETFPLMAKNYGEVSMPENLKKEYNSIFDQLRIIAAELVKHRGEADASIDTRLEFGATAMHVLNRIAGSKELPKDTVEEAQVNLSKIAKQNTKPGMRPEFSATFDAYKTPYVNLPPKLAHNLAEYSKNARKAPMEEASPENYFKRTQESKERLEKDAHLKPRR
ncbi:hypothetical protein BY996DRAFT_6420167 [Phakopsora pachyrhizi]|nr:hypothetical protein BY996DRAFT_6420167 [Phakopsora pachyrhizi]